MNLTARLKWLADQLEHAGLDGVVINPGPSQVYLLGVHFYLFERPIVCLVSKDRTPALVLPQLEVTKARQAPTVLELFSYTDNPGTWQDAFNQAVQSLGWDQKSHPVLGVEDERLRLLEARYLEAALPGVSLRNTSLLANMRMHKDEEEIARIRKAVQIAEAGFNAALPLIKIGMTERELSEEIGLQTQRAGSELPGNPMVAAGPNGANPHATTSDRRLQAGDVVVIDFGAAYQGYLADLTRNLGVGEVDPEFEHIVQVAGEANAAGRAAARPGEPAGAVDRAARAVIEKAGYGPFFTHRTGHGLGSEPHEEPYIYAENTLPLEPGMVFTVEPGIYLPGRAGARVEDDVVITADGCESLSSLPRGLVRVG